MNLVNGLIIIIQSRSSPNYPEFSELFEEHFS